MRASIIVLDNIEQESAGILALFLVSNTLQTMRFRDLQKQFVNSELAQEVLKEHENLVSILLSCSSSHAASPSAEAGIGWVRKALRIG